MAMRFLKQDLTALTLKHAGTQMPFAELESLLNEYRCIKGDSWMGNETISVTGQRIVKAAGWHFNDFNFRRCEEYGTSASLRPL